MLKEGDKAPDFKLLNDQGNEVSISDFRGKTVVLYFYPKDNTSGCTKEAQGFRDLYNDFSEKNIEIIGVSPDSVKTHAGFKEKHSLPFMLLSDPDKKVIKLYGAWGLKKNYGREYEGLIRSTVVINPEGYVIKTYPKIRKAAEHPKKVLEDL